MDHQHGVLTRAVCDVSLNEVIKSRITPDHFWDDEYKRIFEFLVEHWKDYGAEPDEAVLKAAYPNFVVVSSDYGQPLEYYIRGLKLRMETVILQQALRDSLDLVQDDEVSEEDKYASIKDTLRDALARSTAEVTAARDMDVTQVHTEYGAMLEERRGSTSYLRGISTGIDKLDYVTGGWQPEQLITIIGLPKSFKSSLALYLTLQVHAQGKMPLFVGFEMSNDEQMDRMASLLSGVSLTKILNGQFSKREQLQIVKAFRSRKDMAPLVFSADVEGATTVSGVQAKIQEYRPDVVFVDGAYMMDPEDARLEPGSAMALTKITRGLKRLAQKNRITIIVTTQASIHRSKGGVNAASVMYSTSFLQDSDIVFGAERIFLAGEEPDPRDPALLNFKVLLSRSGPVDDVKIEWDWTKGRVLALDDQGLASEEEDGVA